MSELQRLLQKADPTASEPSPGDVAMAQIRQRVLERTSYGPGTVRLRPAWALGVAGLVIVAAAALHQLGDVPHLVNTPQAEPTPVTVEGEPSVSPRATHARQIHFTVPGGTRVIWLLERVNDREATP